MVSIFWVVSFIYQHYDCYGYGSLVLDVLQYVMGFPPRIGAYQGVTRNTTKTFTGKGGIEPLMDDF